MPECRIIWIVFCWAWESRRWQKLSRARILIVQDQSILQIRSLLKNNRWQLLEIFFSRLDRNLKKLVWELLERAGFGFRAGGLSKVLKRHRDTCLDSRDFRTNSNRHALDIGLCVFMYHLDSAVFISREVVSFFAAPNKILARILEV